MIACSKLIPSSSQTVGPYFRIGLEHLIDRQASDQSPPGSIELHGCVIDRDGAPVSDALLEFWGADSSGNYPDTGELPDHGTSNFRRAETNADGRFSISLVKPGPASFGDGRLQAPHCLVLVFARGLLRHLITRVYFEDELVSADPVLLGVPSDRRHTMVARVDQGKERSFEWDVVLQGENETVFFAW